MSIEDGETQKDRFALCKALPDLPRWVEMRSQLLHGTARVFGTLETGGAVIVSTRSDLAQLIGRPSKAVINEAVQMMPRHVELLIVAEDFEYVRVLLPQWRVYPAVLHTRADPIVGQPETKRPHDVEICTMIDDGLRSRLPEVLSDAIRHGHMAAIKHVHGNPVAACHAGALTETLWDVGVDTLPEFRQQGHATDCYRALAEYLAHLGRQPVWGSLKTNDASLGMARSLGFEPVDELVILLRPKSDEMADNH